MGPEARSSTVWAGDADLAAFCIWKKTREWMEPVREKIQGKGRSLSRTVENKGSSISEVNEIVGSQK